MPAEAAQYQAFGSNNNAADGGVAYIGKVRGVATSPGTVGLDLRATALSGAGGDVSVGSGNGGNGGAASLVDVIDAAASTTSGITLRQTATGRPRRQRAEAAQPVSAARPPACSRAISRLPV